MMQDFLYHPTSDQDTDRNTRNDYLTLFLKIMIQIYHPISETWIKWEFLDSIINDKHLIFIYLGLELQAYLIVKME